VTAPLVVPPDEPKRPRTARRAVYDTLSDKSRTLAATVVRWVVTGLILGSTASFIAASEPTLSESAQASLDTFDAVIVSFFTLEYVLRLWSAPESSRLTKYRTLRPLTRDERHLVQQAILAGDDETPQRVAKQRVVEHRRSEMWARVCWALRFGALVDLAAIVPTYAEIALTASGAGVQLPTLTFLRTLRLLRILKTERYVYAWDAVAAAVCSSREIIASGLIVCAILLLVTSALLWFTVTQGGADPPPRGLEALGSVPDAMYATILLLTGQGVPDGQLPLAAKAVVGVTALLSIPVFSVPASMLAWSFEGIAERLRERRRRAKRRRWKAVLSGNAADLSSGSSSGDDGEESTLAGDSILQVTSTDSSGGSDDEESQRRSRRGSSRRGRPAGSSAGSVRQAPGWWRRGRSDEDVRVWWDAADALLRRRPRSLVVAVVAEAGHCELALRRARMQARAEGAGVVLECLGRPAQQAPGPLPEGAGGPRADPARPVGLGLLGTARPGPLDAAPVAALPGAGAAAGRAKPSAAHPSASTALGDGEGGAPRREGWAGVSFDGVHAEGPWEGGTGTEAGAGDEASGREASLVLGPVVCRASCSEGRPAEAAMAAAAPLLAWTGGGLLGAGPRGVVILAVGGPGGQRLGEGASAWGLRDALVSLGCDAHAAWVMDQ